MSQNTDQSVCPMRVCSVPIPRYGVWYGRHHKDRIINLYFFDPWIIPGSHPGRIVTKARRRREVNGWTEIDAIRCIRNTHPAMLLAVDGSTRNVNLSRQAEASGQFN